jgi:hypothetical protein
MDFLELHATGLPALLRALCMYVTHVTYRSVTKTIVACGGAGTWSQYVLLVVQAPGASTYYCSLLQAHQLVRVVAVLAQAVTAEVPHVLPVDAWPDVVELPQHSMLGHINDHLQPSEASSRKGRRQGSNRQPHSTAQHFMVTTQQ